MHLIEARNINDAYYQGCLLIDQYGEPEDSRNGKVLTVRAPVMTHYREPKERVLFCPNRDANPYFHLMEALWMLGGRKDVEFVAQFVKRMVEYSDDGITFNAAYGHRWRKHFTTDQIETIIYLFENDPKDRRIVLQMWDPKTDLGVKGKDFPCNTQVYFKISPHEIEGLQQLDMTVCNRSNDIIWGAYGANAVHMSILQEYMAGRLNLEVGEYYHLSNNFHVYENIWEELTLPEQVRCEYTFNHVKPFSVMEKGFSSLYWDRDLQHFLEDPINSVDGYAFVCPFFMDVALPMYYSHACWKEKRIADALGWAEAIKASDWKLACLRWLQRRIKKNENGISH